MNFSALPPQLGAKSTLRCPINGNMPPPPRVTKLSKSGHWVEFGPNSAEIVPNPAGTEQNLADVSRFLLQFRLKSPQTWSILVDGGQTLTDINRFRAELGWRRPRICRFRAIRFRSCSKFGQTGPDFDRPRPNWGQFPVP